MFQQFEQDISYVHMHSYCMPVYNIQRTRVPISCFQIYALLGTFKFEKEIK